MIHRYEDYIDRIYELYPGIKKESLRKIVKEGLKGLLRLMRDGNDVIIRSYLDLPGIEGYWVKFYTPIFDVKKQHNKARRDLEVRDVVRPKIEEHLKKWKNKSKMISKANKERAKQNKKVKKELTPEEREKAFQKRRKQLRAARMRKIEEQKRKEQNNG